MDKFKNYAEILKNFSKDMEMWKQCEDDDIADAERKYNQNVLPEQIKEIRAKYAKRYETVRGNALTKVENETKLIKQRNQGKFKLNFIDLELLTEINAIGAAGIPMTESEATAYCRRALASRSSFCVRAVQAIARKSGIRLDVPTEDKAVEAIDKTSNRMRSVIEKYDGKYRFGDISKDQSIIMDAHGFGESGFLARYEKEYESCALEDIKVTQMSRKEFDTKEAASRVANQKKPVELAEVGENIGITTKLDGSKSDAARYARNYSAARMNQATESEDYE